MDFAVDNPYKMANWTLRVDSSRLFDGFQVTLALGLILPLRVASEMDLMLKFLDWRQILVY